METRVFDTKPLLRPDQVQAGKEEIASLEAKLTNPLIQDKAEVRRQLSRSKKSFEEQLPRPPEDGDEAGRMERRSKELLDHILQGMPSHEEMRKSPPGAIEKHRSWQSRNKLRIAEWKHIQRRLNAGADDCDSNLEKYRPHQSTLSMDNAFIPGKSYFMPATSGPAVVFSEDHMAALRALSPALADAVALMSNAQRREVKDALEQPGIGIEASSASIAGKRGAERKRVLSEEQKARMKAGREAARKARQA